MLGFHQRQALVAAMNVNEILGVTLDSVIIMLLFACSCRKICSSVSKALKKILSIQLDF